MTIAAAPPKPANLWALGGFLVFTLTVGWLSGTVTAANIPSWYAALEKPSFNPPNSVFMPVWTTLYVLMAISAWRVWGKTGFASRMMGLWALQLALNFAWSFIFFGAHAPLAAFLELAVMWAAIALTILTFWHIDRIAGALLIPYLAWVSFAGVLNFWIWRLNT